MEPQLPKARKDKLVVRDLSEEVLVYDLRAHKAHCLNRTAALVWEHCDGRTTVPKLAALMSEELKVPIDEAVVWLALDQLERFQLLQEQVVRPVGMTPISRRVMMRRLGLAAAVALPLITSIVSPTAAQAQSGCNSVNCPPPSCCSAGICLPPADCGII